VHVWNANHDISPPTESARPRFVSIVDDLNYEQLLADVLVAQREVVITMEALILLAMVSNLHQREILGWWRPYGGSCRYGAITSGPELATEV
jgi:hypothetical protein